MIEKCRMWNTVLDLYNPDVIILAFHPTFALIYTNQAYSTFNAIKKALHLHNEGYRPLVAMGEKFMRAYLANLPGSMADWDGKHFFIHWPKFGFSSRTYQDALKNRQDFRKVKIRLGGREMTQSSFGLSRFIFIEISTCELVLAYNLDGNGSVRVHVVGPSIFAAVFASMTEMFKYLLSYRRIGGKFRISTYDHYTGESFPSHKEENK